MVVRGLFALLALAAAPACLVLTPHEELALHLATGLGNTCQLTMATGLFQSLCGTIELVNTGSAAMAGWRVQFELAPGAELVNGWNGVFTVRGRQVTASSDDPNRLLAPGESVTLGICTEAPPQNVRLLPGPCAGAQGPNAGDNGEPALVIEDALTHVPDGWKVLDGPEYGVGRDCMFQPMEVVGTASGLLISVQQHNLAGPAQLCGAIRSEDSYAVETLTVPLMAARGAGLVTEVSVARKDERGLQGAAFYVAGAGQTAWAVTFQDGTPAAVRLDLRFDPAASVHTYSIARGDGGITWRIDDVTVASSDPRAGTSRVVGRVTLGAWSALDPTWAGKQPEPRPDTAARFAGVTLRQ
jgi:hypothetical protein